MLVNKGTKEERNTSIYVAWCSLYINAYFERIFTAVQYNRVYYYTWLTISNGCIIYILSAFDVMQMHLYQCKCIYFS